MLEITEDKPSTGLQVGGTSESFDQDLFVGRFTPAAAKASCRSGGITT